MRAKGPARFANTTLDEPLFSSPERNLLSSIIELAISDAVNIRTTTFPKDKKEAVRWLGLDGIRHSPEKPYTFEWCCGHLGYDPDTIRRIISEWKSFDRSNYRKATRSQS